MTSVTCVGGLVHVGMDVAKDAIAVGVLRPGEDAVGRTETIFHDEASVRRLVGRFADRSLLRCCYEAGPTGYGLWRQLTSLQVACEVVAPALIPTLPGRRVKTDRRDARRLAELHRAGQLTPVAVPSPRQEAARDLCRARRAMLIDLGRARRRIASLLLRHGRPWRDGQSWTDRHRRWLASQRLEEPAAQAALGCLLGSASAREAELAAVEAQLLDLAESGPFAAATRRLAAYRGIDRLGALTILTEVVDWRRFPTAEAFMAFVGLVPSEHSTGESTRRGPITKTGNIHVRRQLVESAWAYQHRASVSAVLQRRQAHATPDVLARSWAAQQRLCGKFRRLAARKHHKRVAVVAVARELAGFVWAEMTADPSPDLAQAR
jgi:transposase